MSKVSHSVIRVKGESGSIPTLHTELAVTSATPLALVAAPNQSRGTTVLTVTIGVLTALAVAAVIIKIDKDRHFAEADAFAKSNARLRQVLGGDDK